VRKIITKDREIMSSIPTLIERLKIALENQIVDKYEVCSAYYSLILEVLMTFEYGSYHFYEGKCSCETWVKELPQEFSEVIFDKDGRIANVCKDGVCEVNSCFLHMTLEKYGSILKKMKQ
jgi:hypothetical protein